MCGQIQDHGRGYPSDSTDVKEAVILYPRLRQEEAGVEMKDRKCCFSA